MTHPIASVCVYCMQDSIGCTEVCGDGTPFIRETQGWQGAQTLLRHITYDNASRALRFTPVHETHSLRRTPALLDSKFTLNTHAAAAAGRPAVHSPLLPERAPGAAVAATPQGAAPTGALPGQGSEGVVSLTQGRQLEVRLSFSLDLDSQWVSSATLRGIPSVSVTWPVRLGLRVMTGAHTHAHIYTHRYTYMHMQCGVSIQCFVKFIASLRAMRGWL